MKKSFLLLPVSIAILTACSSNSPAPIEMWMAHFLQV